MYPNLMGMKAFHGLTSDDMGNILGISRNAYESKMKSGRFTPKECKLLCRSLTCLPRTMKLPAGHSA